MSEEVDVRSASSTLLLISENQRGYKARLRDVLNIVLEKEGKSWRWQRFDGVLATGTVKVFEYKTLHEYLKKWCRWTFDDLCKLFSDDAEILAKLDAAVQRKNGGDRKSEHISLYNIQSDDPPPTGTSKQAALRRLRKDRPDLLDKVVKGEMSAHAAAVSAGFRRVKTPLDHLKHWWAKASPMEQAEFLDHCGE